MIEIKDLDFEMEQLKATPFFNLKLPVIVNEGKDNERTDLKVVGQGMPFETCIQKIVSMRFANDDTTYSAVGYMNAYVEQVNELTKLVTYTKKVSKTDDEDENTPQEDEECE